MYHHYPVHHQNSNLHQHGKTEESTGNTNTTTTDSALAIATAYTVGALSFSAPMVAGQFLLEYWYIFIMTTQERDWMRK